MARHRRMLAPIQSIKHYVTRTNAAIASGFATGSVIVDAVSVAAVGAATNEIEEGSLVKAVYIEIWILVDGATATNGQFFLGVEKVTPGPGGMTFTDTANLGAYDNKKNVLYVTQGVLGSAVDGNQAVPVLRTWVLIPKGKQRFGLGDRLIVTVAATGQELQHCGIFTYKEYK